jgi:hypothetical protein
MPLSQAHLPSFKARQTPLGMQIFVNAHPGFGYNTEVNEVSLPDFFRPSVLIRHVFQQVATRPPFTRFLNDAG